MSYAIVMHLEEETAPCITMLWEILAEKDGAGQAKFSDEQIRLNYPPHITFAVIDYAADPDALVETIKPIVAGWRPLPVSFDTIAVLPRKPIAPMLARATVTVEILQLNKEFYHAFPPDALRAYHRPKIWQPHVTLARDIPPERIGDALRAVLERWSGFETTLDSVAVAYFRQEGRHWQIREVWRTRL